MKKTLLFLKRSMFFVILMSISIALFYLKETDDRYIFLSDANFILCTILLIIHAASTEKTNHFWFTVPFFMSLILWFDSAYQNILIALAIIPMAFIFFILFLYFGLRQYFKDLPPSFDSAGY